MNHAADVLFRRFRSNPFDRLLIGCPQEMCHDVEKRLHPYLQERIVGRIDVDVENTNPDQVLAAAAPKMEEEDKKRERQALDRLAEGLGAGGRAAAGLDDVLDALNQRKSRCCCSRTACAAPACSARSAAGWAATATPARLTARSSTTCRT